LRVPSKGGVSGRCRCKALKEFVEAYPPPTPAGNLLFGSTEDPENRVYHSSLWQATDHENEMNMLETIMKELALSTEARKAESKANAIAIVIKSSTVFNNPMDKSRAGIPK
jgi:hypothetical protein